MLGVRARAVDPGAFSSRDLACITAGITEARAIEVPPPDDKRMPGRELDPAFSA
jgi:hypothetical protein